MKIQLTGLKTEESQAWFLHFYREIVNDRKEGIPQVGESLPNMYEDTYEAAYLK